VLFNGKFVLFNHDFARRPIEEQKLEDSGFFLPSNRFLEKAR
jgi:hypothetical protein